MQRQNFSSGAKWESIVGYSRAVRVGNQVWVTGTVAADENGVVGAGDVYEQARFVLQKIEKVLVQAGATLSDVVQTRIYVTDISRWEEVAQAHREVFAEILPTTTMVEVSALIAPDYLVEIEAVAVVNV